MIDLRTIKDHLNITDRADDVLLGQYLLSAISTSEKETGIVIKQRELEKKLQCFLDSIPLYGPVVSVERIRYYDQLGIEQELLQDSVYEVEAGLFGGVYRAFERDWPQVQARRNAITVHYTSGYTSATVPDDIKAALLILVAHLYENREPLAGVQLYKVPMSYTQILSHYRQVQV